MTWTLEISHIGLTKSGDATLIVASDGEKMKRSVLIDGGRHTDFPATKSFITSKYGKNFKIDIVINTHYDADHLNGIRYLLNNCKNISSNSTIYDQGIPGIISIEGKGFHQSEYKSYVATVHYKGTETLNYFHSIDNRVHPTKMVSSDCEVEKGDPHSLSDGGFLSSGHLIYQEIFWQQPSSPTGVFPAALTSLSYTYQPAPAHNIPPPQGTIPEGAPTIECIAANQHYAALNKTGKVLPPPLSTTRKNPTDPKNDKSLAFLVNFGSFTYYIGGDLTSDVEDNLIDYIQQRRGKTFYMKASHHGSEHSTSKVFLEKLAPEAVFISNGLNNQYPHPSVETIKRLAICKSVNTVFVTGSLPQYSKQKGVPTLSNEDTKKIEPSPKALVSQRAEEDPLINPLFLVNVIVKVDASGNAITETHLAAGQTLGKGGNIRPNELDSQIQRSGPSAEAAISGVKI
ncbi:ComEC/Rec2 family competence protein [Thalassospira lucentensis]|uniref:ComEC/Rec2 family competence protein n=1 Tax=Thalassospira lucentensis TaxID=168935 RepID=UPI003AA9011E